MYMRGLSAAGPFARPPRGELARSQPHVSLVGVCSCRSLHWLHLAPSYAVCLCAPRFAEYDVFGLATGLATSWAVLAASSQHSLEQNYPACAQLQNYAGMSLQVRAGCTPHGRPPRTGCSAEAGCAPRRWSCAGAWPMSRRSGASRPCPGLPSWRSASPASQKCLCGWPAPRDPCRAACPRRRRQPFARTVSRSSPKCACLRVPATAAQQTSMR
jgi:hypothetical protein